MVETNTVRFVFHSSNFTALMSLVTCCRLHCDAIAARVASREYSSELSTLEEMQKKQSISHSSEAVRNKLEQAIKATAEKAQEEKARTSGLLDELMALDFWPTRRVRPPTKEEEERERNDALQARTLQSRVELMDGSVHRLESQIQDLKALVAEKVNKAQTEATATSSSNKAEDPTSGSNTGEAPSGETRILRHQLAKLEDKITDLENLLTQAEYSLGEDIDSKIEEQLVALKEELKDQVGDRESRIEEMKESQRRLDDELGNLIQIVENLSDDGAQARDAAKKEFERVSQGQQEVRPDRPPLCRPTY